MFLTKNRALLVLNLAAMLVDIVVGRYPFLISCDSRFVMYQPTLQRVNPIGYLNPAYVFVISYTTTLSDRSLSLPALLVSRFFINLRRADTLQGRNDTTRFSHFSIPDLRIPTIASFVGDLGEPLVHEERGCDEDTHGTSTDSSNDGSQSRERDDVESSEV